MHPEASRVCTPLDLRVSVTVATRSHQPVSRACPVPAGPGPRVLNACTISDKHLHVQCTLVKLYTKEFPRACIASRRSISANMRGSYCCGKWNGLRYCVCDIGHMRDSMRGLHIPMNLQCKAGDAAGDLRARQPAPGEAGGAAGAREQESRDRVGGPRPMGQQFSTRHARKNRHLPSDRTALPIAIRRHRTRPPEPRYVYVSCS